MRKLNKKSGFTLAELLIVVAIIAVLVAIAIPVFTTQLERSRETTDMANIRSAYAAGTTAALTGYIGTAEIGDTTTEKSFFYDPSVNGSLVSSGGVSLGQGTATDGKADTSALPGGCTYKTTDNVKGKVIEVKIKDGAVTSVNFSTT